ncbi:DUF6069 family protein [Leifsonia sp. NPDC056824]|uniref:DUF6069 family protein n=1 Tax=Leifsonia sp. NPDC056824 TaxID=3345953 RepID=UPI0036BC10D0
MNARMLRSTRARSVVWVLAAVVASLAVWLVAAMLDIALTVSFGPGLDQTVTPVAIAIVALVAGLAAWGTLTLVTRFGVAGRRWWIAVALAVLALSLSGPLAFGVGGDVKAALLAMHLVAGGTLIAGLTAARSNRAR